MTLITKLGFKPRKQANLIAPVQVQASDISIVIPVRNNQKGIDLFLNNFFQTHNDNLYPQEIIIVDNNSQPEITIPQQYQVKSFPIRLLKCSKIGPAAARNVGIKHAKGDWILFTDSDCIPSETFIQGYLQAMNGSIGYAGNVKAWGKDILSSYYESQEILLPFTVIAESGIIIPEYLITANALVWKKALLKIGGFNEKIQMAAGEDIDLGWRLLEIGKLSYALNSVTYHNFEDDILGFCQRFIRYGQGNKMISNLYAIDLMPKMFSAKKNNFLNQTLARLQYACLLWGYITHSVE